MKVSKSSTGLSYYIVNESSENTILFIHGNSQSKESFRNQLGSPLLSGYRLISVDLPGHGDSEYRDKYSIISMGEEVATFSKELGINPLFVGHSMGGHIAIESLSMCQSRGLFIYGTPPVSIPMEPEKIFLPNENLSLIYKNELSDDEKETFFSLLFEREYPDMHIEMNSISNTDPSFREKFAISLREGKFRDEIKALGNYTGVLNIGHSRQELLLNGDYLSKLDLNLEAKLIISFDGRHTPHIENIDKFNNILARMASKVFN